MQENIGGTSLFYDTIPNLMEIERSPENATFKLNSKESTNTISSLCSCCLEKNKLIEDMEPVLETSHSYPTLFDPDIYQTPLVKTESFPNILLYQKDHQQKSIGNNYFFSALIDQKTLLNS